MSQRDTQMDWTRDQLLTHGEVSRNDALKIFFTRLGARIDDLKKEGWEIEAGWVKTSHGKDYVYRLIRFNSPSIPAGWDFGNNQQVMKL